MSIDWAPVGSMLALAGGLSLAPLAWIWLHKRKQSLGQKVQALTLLTLFLTFDLVIFGAFTRLTNSGLGCPDWPGCYGALSPFGAIDQIQLAQEALPHGPVSQTKAWIEMIHRYFASMVGALLTILLICGWWLTHKRQATVSPWWPTATWLWVLLQGALGALTVTWKLYPGIVTLHLLGGLGLLLLLVIQTQVHKRKTLQLTQLTAWGVRIVFLLTVLQIILGAWVSTNYAVLACTEFPKCQGTWLPPMEFIQAYNPLRDLGRTTDGAYLSLAGLTAIHMVHRLGAFVLLLALIALAVGMLRQNQSTAIGRPWALTLMGLGLWQLLTGLSNVVLGWPLVAALAHTTGAALLIMVLAVLWVRMTVDKN